MHDGRQMRFEKVVWKSRSKKSFEKVHEIPGTRRRNRGDNGDVDRKRHEKTAKLLVPTKVAQC